MYILTQQTHSTDKHTRPCSCPECQTCTDWAHLCDNLCSRNSIQLIHCISAQRYCSISRTSM